MAPLLQKGCLQGRFKSAEEEQGEDDKHWKHIIWTDETKPELFNHSVVVCVWGGGEPYVPKDTVPKVYDDNKSAKKLGRNKKICWDFLGLPKTEDVLKLLGFKGKRVHWEFWGGFFTKKLTSTFYIRLQGNLHKNRNCAISPILDKSYKIHIFCL